jgi:hypothetical protein
MAGKLNFGSLAEMQGSGINWGALGVDLAAEQEKEKEQKYQDLLGRRIEKYKQMGRLKADLAKAGIGIEMTDEERYAKLLDKRIKGYETAKRLKSDLARAGIGVELTEEQKYQKALDNRIKKYETAARLKKDLIKLGYEEAPPEGGGPWAAMKGRMATALGGREGMANLAFWAKVGDTIGQRIQAHIPGQTLAEYNLQPGEAGMKLRAGQARQFRANVGDIRSAITLGGLTDYVMPSLGRTFDQAAGAFEMNQMFAIRQQETEGMHGNLGLQRQREGIKAQQALRRLELKRQIVQFSSLMRFGMSSAAEQEKSFLGGQAALTRFQGVGAGQAGYARGEAMRDFAGTIGHAVQKAQMEVEQRRQMNILAAERDLARGHVTARLASVKEARQQVKAAERQREQKSPDEEVNTQRRIAVENAYIALKERERALDEARGHAQQLEVRRAEQLNQHSMQRLGLMEQEYSRLQGIARQEKEREVSRKSAFGLMHPMRQRAALGVAMKMRQGRQLTQQEIEFAGGMPDIFGHRLQQLGEQRAGQFGFYQQMRQMLPELGERQRLAERAAGQLQQQFNVAIQFDPQKTADQLLEKVLPVLTQALTEVKVRQTEDLNRLQNAHWLQRAAMHGR